MKSGKIPCLKAACLPTNGTLLTKIPSFTFNHSVKCSQTYPSEDSCQQIAQAALSGLRRDHLAGLYGTVRTEQSRVKKSKVKD